MEPSQLFAHDVRLFRRHDAVGRPVMDVDARLLEVPREGHHPSGGSGPFERFEEGRTPVGRIAAPAAVTGDVGIACARRNGGKEGRIGRPEVPRPVATHRVAGQVDARGVGLKDAPGLCEHLQGVDPPPLFPVEAEGAPVGRCDDVGPLFLFVGPRLVARLDRSAVHGQHEGPRRGISRIGAQGGSHAVILHAAVDAADEGALVMDGRRDLPQGDGHRIDLFAVAQELQPGVDGPVPQGFPGGRQAEFQLTHRQRHHVVGAVLQRLAQLFAVRCKQGGPDRELLQCLLGGVHDPHGGPLRLVLSLDQVGQGHVAPGEHHRFLRHDEFRLDAPEPAGGINKLIEPLAQPNRGEGITEVVVIPFVRFAVDVCPRAAGGLQQGDPAVGAVVSGIEVGRTHLRAAEAAGGVGRDRTPDPCRKPIGHGVPIRRCLALDVGLIGHDGLSLGRIDVSDAVAGRGGAEAVGGVEPGDHVLSVVEGAAAHAAGQ